MVFSPMSAATKRRNRAHRWKNFFRWNQTDISGLEPPASQPL